MKKPKMILFDYGQTLINESIFDGLAGQTALLDRAIKNGSGATAEDIYNLVEELEQDIGRYNLDTVDSYKYEIHNFNFQRYINEYFELEFNLEPWQVEKIFWDNASPATATEGIEELLKYLVDNNIRTGVISNISFGEHALKERINELIPTNHFEFIMATSDYVFRKPSKYIFQFALKKTGLKPEEVWYCGDNPAYDVDGSVNVGMTGVWYTGAIRHESVAPKSHHIHIENWKELIHMLNS